MHLEDRIKNGMTFYEHGHTDPIDIERKRNWKRRDVTAKK